MSFRYSLLASTLALIIPFTASAATDKLATPIVELMPHVKQLRSELNLNAEQQRVIDAWIAEAPLKRKALEAEVKALRGEMRDAILDNRSRLVREELKTRIAQKQTRLIEMRALCTRMLRNTLDAEQFARVVGSYRTSI